METVVAKIFLQCIGIAWLICAPLRAEKIFFPRIVTGQFWDTTFRIMNLGDEDVSIPAQFYRRDGSPWDNLGLRYYLGGDSSTKPDGQEAIRIGAHDITQYDAFDFANQTEVGYFVIDADPEIAKLSGFYTYYPDGDKTRSPQARVGLLSTRAGTLMSAPFDSDTAVSVINAEDHPIEVYLQLLTHGDSVADQKEFIYDLELDAHQSRGLFLRSLDFLGLDSVDFFGQLHLWSEGGEDRFAALTLIFPANGVFTSVPVDIREDMPFDYAVPTPTIENFPLMRQPKPFNSLTMSPTVFRVRIPRQTSELIITLTAQSPSALVLATPRELPTYVFPWPCQLSTTSLQTTRSCVLENPKPGYWFIELFGEATGNVRGEVHLEYR